MSFSEATQPLLDWIPLILQNNAGIMEGNDLILTEKGAKRFLIGIHNKNPLICWNEHDAKALENIKWTSSALVFNLKGKDWIALSCQDIRIKNSEALNPVRFRIFVPIIVGRLDVWKEVRPTTLAGGRIKMIKGAPKFDGTPFMTVPLKLMG